MEINILPALSGPKSVVHFEVGDFTVNIYDGSNISCENFKKLFIDEMRAYLNKIDFKKMDDRIEKQTLRTKIMKLLKFRRERKAYLKTIKKATA